MKVVALLVGLNLLTPISDEVPNLNVAPSCRGASQIKVADAQSFDDCMKDENDARAQLARSWQSFSVLHRVNCTAEASLDGLASYVDLLTCLQMANAVEPEKRTSLKGARRK